MTSDLPQKRVRGFVPARDDRERFLMKRAEELAQQALQRGTPRYSGFLSDREQDLCRAALNRVSCGCYTFRGGYPQAERCILCIEPPDSWQEQPMECLQAVQRYPADGPLRHQDYMGALLALGIERSCVGDICLLPQLPDRAYLFVTADKADFICRELTQAGRAALTVSICPEIPQQLCLPLPREVRSATVSSLRLDAVLAAILRCGRSQAAALIESGRVEINHLPCQSAHAEVFEQDVFTIRGKGRFKLEQIGGKSRKDRIYISFFQY